MPSLGLGLSIDKSGVVPNPIIPASLKPNAIALYTTRPQGLSDFAVNMTNAATNGDFSNGTTGWGTNNATLTTSNNVASITGDGSGAYPGINQTTGIIATSGRKISVIGSAKVLSPGCTQIYVELKSSNGATALGTQQIKASPTAGVAYPFALQIPLGATADVVRLYIRSQYADAATANGKVMEVQEVMCIDLSTPFSLSNEPTAAEFADMLTYKGKTYWNGTEPVVINPNDKYYWPDRSGLGRHLHAVNVAYDATGGVQAGPTANWLCDGVNDYLVFNSATDIVSENGAVSAFVVFQAKDAVNATHRIASLSDTTTASITLTATPTGISCVVTDSVSGTSTATATLTVNANQWYSVTFGYDTATKKAFISVNGGTISLGTAITNGVKKINKFVLASNANVSAFNNDRLGEFPVLNKSATQADCKSLHNNVASRYGLTKV